MIAHPSVPAATVAEFIAHAKSNMGKVNMASAGNGSISHMAGELFKMMAGVDLLHVPYRGASPALTDLLGGQVQVMFASAPSSIEYVRTGKVRGLAVTTAKRSPTLPDLPTVGESVRSRVVRRSSTQGYACRDHRKAQQGNQCSTCRFQDEGAACRCGGTVLPVSPAEFGKLIADD
jgi:tripartite-type tricarboxylate transporter receptor subunit TctC